MSEKSKIEWTSHTENPWSKCVKEQGGRNEKFHLGCEKFQASPYSTKALINYLKNKNHEQK